MKSAKRMNRRLFLRGSGAALALPALVSLLPREARAQTAPKRYVQLYHPNGTTQSRGDSTPPADLIGRFDEFRSKMTVVTNMDNQPLRFQNNDYFPRHHHWACAGPLYTGGVMAGVGGEVKTVDQHIADEVGAGSRLPTLAINLFPKFESHEGVPASFVNSMGWRGSRQPIEPYSSPRAVFEVLFAGGTGTAAAPVTSPEQQVRNRRRQLVLDALTDEIRDVTRRVSAHDRLRLDEYLTGIADLDRRTRDMMDDGPDMPAATCDGSEPSGLSATESNYPAYLQVMQELSLRALQCDATRVVTLVHCSVAGFNRLLGHDFVPGIEGPWNLWHVLSHWETGEYDSNTTRTRRDLGRVTGWHYDRVADFVRRLQGTTSLGGGNLLDETLVTWGSSMSHGSSHSADALYHVLFGGGSTFSHGSNINAGAAPTANMHSAIMRGFGVGERLGMASGEVGGILS